MADKPEDSLDREAILDRTPLSFGKWKDKTPEWVAENEPLRAGQRSWLIWAFENVGNGDVCSTALYRELGGRGSRAKVDKTKRDYRTYRPEQGNLDLGPQNYPRDTYESRGSSRAIGASSFDDMDDDIPF